MKYFIAANWKMNKTITETREFLRIFMPAVRKVKDVDIVIAPPFTSLSAAYEKIKGSNIVLSAQNIFWEEKAPTQVKFPPQCWLTLDVDML